MPANWLFVDTQFPSFTGQENLKEQVRTIQDYMYLLVEQLRYTLHNLDLTNMNDAAVEEYIEMITEPILAQIEDADGNIARLELSQAGLQSQVQSQAGQISSLQQTAGSLQSQIQDAEGNITALQQTTTSISTLVAGQGGQISTLQQKVDGFYLSVSNGSNYSTITLMSGSAAISSQTIYMTGVVTFTNLSTQGQTVINGGNIAAGGTISGCTLRSLSAEDGGLQICYGSRSYYQLVGGIKYDTNGAGTDDEAKNRMFIYTQNGWAMKLQSGASASWTATGEIYVSANEGVVINGAQSKVDLRGSLIMINSVNIDEYIRQVVAAG